MDEFCNSELIFPLKNFVLKFSTLEKKLLRGYIAPGTPIEKESRHSEHSFRPYRASLMEPEALVGGTYVGTDRIDLCMLVYG